MSRNGAHGLCLQLGGLVEATGSLIHARTRARAHALTRPPPLPLPPRPHALPAHMGAGVHMGAGEGGWPDGGDGLGDGEEGVTQHRSRPLRVTRILCQPGSIRIT